MSDRLSNGAWRKNAPRSWHTVSMGKGREAAGSDSTAARKGAMKQADTAWHLSGTAARDCAKAKPETTVGPAGVPGRRTGFRLVDQTPAGEGGQCDAQARLRVQSAAAIAFPPEGSLPARDETA